MAGCVPHAAEQFLCDLREYGQFLETVKNDRFKLEAGLRTWKHHSHCSGHVGLGDDSIPTFMAASWGRNKLLIDAQAVLWTLQRGSYLKRKSSDGSPNSSCRGPTRHETPKAVSSQKN